MTTSDIYDELKTVFADVFDEDDLVLTPATTADNVDGWDSLAHIRLMVSVQKTFDIKLSASEIGALKNVGDLVATHA
jgi:acyl carrier protein